jgi:hypothetical protein
LDWNFTGENARHLSQVQVNNENNEFWGKKLISVRVKHIYNRSNVATVEFCNNQQRLYAYWFKRKFVLPRANLLSARRMLPNTEKMVSGADGQKTCAMLQTARTRYV